MDCWVHVSWLGQKLMSPLPPCTDDNSELLLKLISSEKLTLCSYSATKAVKGKVNGLCRKVVNLFFLEDKHALFAFFKRLFGGLLLNLTCVRYVRVQGSTVHGSFLQYAYLILQLQQLSYNRVCPSASLNTITMPKKPDAEHCQQWTLYKAQVYSRNLNTRHRNRMSCSLH